MKEYCCQFMQSQLNYPCTQHPDNTCPDILVRQGSSGYYCPVCGHRQPVIDVEDEEE